MANSRLGRFCIVGLVGLAGAALGCGDDGSTLPQFVGTWKYTGSSIAFSCPNQAPQAIPLTQKTWRLGAKSDLVDLSSNCAYKFDVNDKIATIQTGQTCAFDDANGAPAVESPTTWVFTLTSATSAVEQVTTVTTFVDGVMCTIDGSAMLDKLTKD